jgi:hypothetical protein
VNDKWVGVELMNLNESNDRYGPPYAATASYNGTRVLILNVVVI